MDRITSPAPEGLLLWGDYAGDPTVPYNNWTQFKSSFNQVNPLASKFVYGDDDRNLPTDNAWSAAKYIQSLDVDDEERLRLWQLGWNTRSQDHFDQRVAKHRKELYDREVVASRGFWEGLGYDMVGSVLDPVVLASTTFLGPLALTGRLATTALRSGALVGAEVGLQEMQLQKSQRERTFAESGAAMAGGVILGSVLGGMASPFYRAVSTEGKGAAKIIADTVNDIQRNEALNVDLPPVRQPWKAPGPLRPVDESNLTLDQVNARIDAENAEFFPEGGKFARKWMKMHYMTDTMAGQLFRGPFGRRIMGSIVSLDGFLPANFKGKSRDPIAPAEPAIERAQNEFGREYYDFFANSMRMWAEHEDHSLAQRIIGQHVNDTDVIEHNTRFGEIWTAWAANGRDTEILKDFKLTSGERRDYSWMEPQLKAYDEITENYTYWQIANGGFKEDFNELLLGNRSMGIDEAEARISELKAKEVEDQAIEAERDKTIARERALEDREVTNRNKEAQKVLDKELKEFNRSLDELGKMRDQLKKELARRQALEVKEFDRITLVNKNTPIKRRKYKNQPVQEYRYQQTVNRQAERKKMEKRHKNEYRQLEKNYKKETARKYKDWDKRTEGDRLRIERERTKIDAKRVKADAKTRAKTETRQMGRMWESQRLTKGIDDLRRIEEGDINYAFQLTKRFNGEDFYRPQIISRERMQALGKETFIESMIDARASWLTKNIARDYTSDYDRQLFEVELEKLREGSQDPAINQKYSEMYDYLMDETNLENDFQTFSDMREIRAPTNRYKKREYKYDQSLMMDFLENDLNFLMGAHLRSVVPELVLKQRGLWDAKDIKGLKDEAYREVDAQIQRIMNDPKLSNRQKSRRVKSWQRDFKRLEGAIDNTLRTLRNEDYLNSKQWQKDTVYVLNTLNGMRTLGTVLPASITDVPQSMSKVGGEYLINQLGTAKGAWEEALQGASKDDLTKWFGLFEYGQGNTITKIMESDEIGPNQSSWLRRVGRAQAGFYHSTIIIKWNQGFKENAALGFAHRVIDAALGTGKPLTKHDQALLARDGWDADRLALVAEVYKKYGVPIPGPNGKDSGAKIINHYKIRKDIKEADALTKTDRERLQQLWRISEDFGTAMNNLAYRAVVTPGASDLPDMAKHSVYMKLLFALKTFNLTSLNRTTLPVFGAVKNGDAGMAAYAIAASGMGSLSYIIRQKIYDREITENPQTLFWEGFNRSGMLGIYNQGLTVTQMLTGNFFGLGDALKLEVPSRYYARGALTDIFGPTLGLAEAGLGVVNVYSRAIKGEDISDAEYAKAYRLMPFNNLFYLRAAFERIPDDG